MTPKNEEKLQQIREERREQIMEAALKIFARRGVIGTKTSMIAKEAGVSEGLLYRYFKSKDELFTHLVQFATKESIDAMIGVYQLTGSPTEKIRTLTEHILDEENQLGFLLIHQARTSEGVPIEAKQILEQHPVEVYIDQIEPLFVEGQKTGEIIAGDPRKLIANYLMVLSGLMTINIYDSGDYQMLDVDLLMRMFTIS